MSSFLLLFYLIAMHNRTDELEMKNNVNFMSQIAVYKIFSILYFPLILINFSRSHYMLTKNVVNIKLKLCKFFFETINCQLFCPAGSIACAAESTLVCFT